MADTRQWLWVAVLILALTGMSAVRQEGLKNGGGSSVTTPPIDFGTPSGGDPGGGISGGPFGGPPANFGDIPTDIGGGSTTSSGDISDNLTTALINGAGILVGWVVLAVLLCEVSLFNGQMPSFGQNLQVAIWTTVPIAVMAGLQLVYFAGNGPLREPGISGLLQYWDGYETLPTFLKSLVLSLTTQLTIFWLWGLVLIYVGGRNALQGKRWAVLIVVVAWAVVTVVAPVITGAVAAPESTISGDPLSDSGDGGEVPFDLGLGDPSSDLPPVMPDSTLPPELQFLNEPPPTESAPDTQPEQTVEPGAETTGEAAQNDETFILGPSFEDVTAEATPEVGVTPAPSDP